MKWWDWMPWSWFLKCRVLSQLFHSPFSPSSRGSLLPLYFLTLEWYHLHICGYWYCSWQSWFHLVEVLLGDKSGFVIVNQSRSGLWFCSSSTEAQKRWSLWSDHTYFSYGVLSFFSRVWLFATPWTVARQAPSVHGILQARILESVAIPFSRGSSRPRDRTCVSYVSLHWQAGSLPPAPRGKSVFLQWKHHRRGLRTVCEMRKEHGEPCV